MIQHATNELIVGALFFGMRLCEYSQVPTAQERVTKLLQLKDLHFYDENNKLLDQTDKSLGSTAHTMTITFQNQKNRHQLQVVPINRSDNTLCPIQIWARIVTRLWSYVNTSIHTAVNTVKINGRAGTFVVTKSDVENRLRTIVRFLGETKLGIKITDVGCHSIRATFATILQLTTEKETTIQHGGRWKSDCYKSYMRKDITNGDNTISANLSNPNTGNFFTFQSSASTTQRSTMGLREDPRRASSQSSGKPKRCKLGPLFL